jgi:hypothetical protein
MTKFKVSMHHIWIQYARVPKKAWMEMQYCVTKEEIDWTTQWNIPIEKPTTNPSMKQSTKTKEKDKEGSSAKLDNPTDNTRKVAV